MRSNGAQARGHGGSVPSISATGRFVAFQSAGTNLVPGDTNSVLDVFVHDLRTGKTRRVSVRSNGKQGGAASREPSISANGRRIAFTSRAPLGGSVNNNRSNDVFVHNLNTARTRQVSVSSRGRGGNGNSIAPSISANGRKVAFTSGARNLAPGPYRTGDVFVHNLGSGKTRRLVSAKRRKVRWLSDPSISANGRRVAFESLVTGLPGDSYHGENVFVYNRKTRRMRSVSIGHDGQAGDCESRLPSLSPNGRRVAFQSPSSNIVADDTNGDWDVFARMLGTGQTRRASVSSAGAEANEPSGLDFVFDRRCL